LGIKLGRIPLNVSISVKKVITNTPEAIFDVLCGVRFAGFDKSGVGRNSSALRASNETVIGQIVIAEGTIGHEQIIASALATVRGRLNSANLNRVIHS
jgi:hypothetical protein